MTSHVRSATPPPGGTTNPARSQTPPPTPPCHPTSPTSLARPRSLMESLLIAKMERASGGPSVLNGTLSGSLPSPLLRMDSMDSASSFASTSSMGSDVCRCDDCLLGIADLYINTPSTKKKVGRYCDYILGYVLHLDCFSCPPHISNAVKETGAVTPSTKNRTSRIYNF